MKPILAILSATTIFSWAGATQAQENFNDKIDRILSEHYQTYRDRRHG